MSVELKIPEKWKDIPGYDGIYEASSDGRIRTCAGKTTSNAKYPVRVWKQRELKQKIYPNNKGRSDARVNLWKDGKEKTWLVSRLVALTWCEGYAPDLTVNHKDGNPLNNKAENLEWITLEDNIRHGHETGLYRKTQIPVVVVNGADITMYQSLAEASRALGHNSGYLSEKYVRIKKGG